jgi:hypothetical protein
MEFNKNTSSGKTNVIGLVIKSILGLVVILGLVFFLNTIDFPSPKKEIEKIIPMKILKLLNKKIFINYNYFFIFIFLSIAEDKPVDIWNIDKKE